MSAKTPSISHKFSAVARMAALALALFPGCAIFGAKKPPTVLSRQRVYFAPVADIERAMKQAMVKYPQRVDDPEAGIYETDWIKGDVRFKPAHQPVTYPDGYRYRLVVRLVKGKSTAKPAVKVVVSKQIELQRDFFSEPEAVPSDGLEETLVLYRIQRELSIEKAIKRAQEKSNSGEKPGDDGPVPKEEGA